MALLGLVIGWILTIFLGVVGAIILWKMIDGTINLRYLISDELGWASLSRFQFLLFTLVIAMSLFFVIANHQPVPDYPTKIPPEILALLGLSGGSYVLSKGIQSSRDVSLTEANHPPSEASDPDNPSSPPT